MRVFYFFTTNENDFQNLTGFDNRRLYYNRFEIFSAFYLFSLQFWNDAYAYCMYRESDCVKILQIHSAQNCTVTIHCRKDLYSDFSRNELYWLFDENIVSMFIFYYTLYTFIHIRLLNMYNEFIFDKRYFEIFETDVDMCMYIQF